MPKVLTQNRGQFLAQQALITAQTAARSLNSNLLRQSDAAFVRQSNDQLTSARQQDRAERQNLQAMNTQLLLSSQTRIAGNESQAEKVAASQKDMAAYQVTQMQSALVSKRMTLGYA